MNYIQIEFITAQENEREILIALLFNAGFESFEEREKSLLAFIKEDSFIKEDLEDILINKSINYVITILPQQNWNEHWERSFEPILVNDFVSIRANFHKTIQKVKHEIIITPKMSFGTGHHATTYMMIEQMEGLNFNNKTVLDFGTGTAVLSILAEKMGASSIHAIDCDSWSIENSIENKEANHCKKINLIKSETISAGPIYDIILANINLNVILNNLDAIKEVGKTGTIILLSGFIKTDELVMLEALRQKEITQLKTLQKGEWISVCCIMS